MKRACTAALWTLAISVTAAAQPASPAPGADTVLSQCGAIGAAPTIPDGTRATAAQMHNADGLYRAWAADAETKLRCRALEIEAADQRVKTAAATYQAQSANARAVADAYDAAIQAFNTRGAQAHANRNDAASHP